MEFITYKSFYEQEEVEILTKLLNEKGIDFQITEDSKGLDYLYGERPFATQFFVKLRKEDFIKVDSLVLAVSEGEIESASKDHYLYGFTDEELFEILTKPDEWSAFDYQLSRKLLKERGKEINMDAIELLRKQRIIELSKPEQGQKNWVYAGYLFALLGGLIGVFIGWHLRTFKKTLPNGQQVFGYNQEDRNHGAKIFIIGVFMFLISLAAKFSNRV